MLCRRASDAAQTGTRYHNIMIPHASEKVTTLPAATFCYQDRQPNWHMNTTAAQPRTKPKHRRKPPPQQGNTLIQTSTAP